MAQAANMVEQTDKGAWLRENRKSRLCRARGHRWPDPPEEHVLKAGHLDGEWELLTDAAKGEPNVRLLVECERGCGSEVRVLGFADFKKQTLTIDTKYTKYDADYLMQGGVRLTRTEAEAAILFDQLQPIAAAAKPKPKKGAAAKKKPSRHLKVAS